MKTKSVYYGLAVFSAILFIAAIIQLILNGLKEGKSIFIQIAPLLLTGICFLLFSTAYKKAVRRELP